MIRSTCLSFILLTLVSISCYAQGKQAEAGSPAAKGEFSIFNSSVLNTNFLDKINSKAEKLQASVEKKSLKTLKRLQKQEAKLYKKLALKDSVAAKALFAKNKYEQLANRLRQAQPDNGLPNKKLKEYIPEFDSLKTSLKFLASAKDLTPALPNAVRDEFSKGEGVASTAFAKGEGVVASALSKGSGVEPKLPFGFQYKLTEANKNIAGLESKMQQANEIKQYIKERRELLKNTLAKYGMLKEMKQLNKEAYYYQQQLNEYKAMLSDPGKLEKKALAELRKLPAFTSFMKKNSQLAQLFGPLQLPQAGEGMQSLAGLQTRASIQSQIQQRFGGAPSGSPNGGGMNPQQYIQQQVQQAQGELSKLKNQLNKAGGGSGDMDMPDFKPNSQKTKTFWKRVEYGANVQSQRPNGLLPVTTDFALTAGYKLNDKSIAGFGASYKLGWGKSISHIRFSHQGVGLRSYVDYKIGSGFWLSGGYELNYQHEFEKIYILKDLSSWQRSGLAGITKKYKIGKKTNNMQLLWDFLSEHQVPRTQPILFRVGYVFN